MVWEAVSRKSWSHSKELGRGQPRGGLGILISSGPPEGPYPFPGPGNREES